jgi:hypothetical protein
MSTSCGLPEGEDKTGEEWIRPDQGPQVEDRVPLATDGRQDMSSLLRIAQVGDDPTAPQLFEA